MEVDLLWLTLIVTLVGYLYYQLTKNNEYFLEKPIPSLPVRPFFGSSAALLLKQATFSDFIKNAYEKFPGVKVFGMFETTTPFFVIRDPELIKRIAVKDFDHFVDHRPTFGNHEDSDNPYVLFGRSLFAMNGQRWRDMRATLSPAFTGSKMRQMFGLIGECGEDMVRFFENQMKGSGSVEVEVKDMLGRFGVNVIATCAFGLKVDSFLDRDNEFYRHGKEMMQFGKLSVLLKIIALRMLPKFCAWLGVDVVSREQAVYFSNIIKETVRSRESQGIVRHDMVDLLLQAKKGTLKHHQEKEMQEGFATVEESDVGKVEMTKPMSEAEMIAQCFIFFLAGFDTVSTSAMLAIYELVRNPEIQEKLYEEVKKTHSELGGKPLTYDAVQKMKYMDMVVSESLRLWSPAPAIDRLCVRDYVLDDGEGLKFTIDKGTCVWFPAHGLHHDPRYYPNPEKFEPERFNDENKKKVHLATYMPFGIGPRNCIGSRFALMEVKTVIYHLLLKFSFERSENTQIPLKLRKGFTALGTEKGMYVRLRARKNV
ncbi:cytochrome P450 9e2-like [Toxorhynchites rutilus septentrionalis]|uniref:cytochrome P450 9e2-like n=1 Tax=Toxorhynchites rutilus septentrionalis TaxID=329112 RepID=UPI00247A0643|nr:cytochrome P450 9e2-like [Toxorhynchites rutilus septentrionalis]